MLTILRRYYHCMLLATIVLLAACADIEGPSHPDGPTNLGRGVLVLCEGNFNSGNSTISYYNPETKQVENGIFQRVNDRKLGDTGQSITIHDGVAYVAMENSGIIWGMDTETFRVRGQLTTGQTEHMINPRYIHFLSDDKAYVTDLYSPYITIFNPQTYQYLGSISTGQPTANGYASTEQMAQYDRFVFTNCWCYSKNILVIDSQRDEVVDSIILTSWQPKSLKMDCNGKLWVITDGGYSSAADSFGENMPHLYRIDAQSREIELDLTLPTDEASVQLALSPRQDILYLINNDIYRMSVTDNQIPSTPFILAPVDEKGTRHKLYGIDVNPANGDIYVADAVDYRQSGVAYRYSSQGTLIDQFRVGINPNGFAFTQGSDIVIPTDSTHTTDSIDHALVSKVFEYMPAPGHQVNGYTVTGDFIHDGATMAEACDSVLAHFQRRWMVSLGGQGGYVVAGFDHPVTNSQGGVDLIIRGNPYSYQSEPGIVWVSQDVNGNGLPDDPWYELAGSEYGTDNETLDYAITYYKPTAAGQDIRWTDNQGGEGVIPYMSAWNTHASYWQDWVPSETTPEGECRTYYGSRLRDTHTYENGFTLEPPFDWGYADNLGNDCQNSCSYLRLSNAVRADGTPANLPCIHFVKVQTGQTGCSPNLGEISTEVYGIWDAKLYK